MKTSKMLVVFAAGSALWSCNQPVPTTQTSSGISRDDAAVLVNGRPISRLSVENLEQEFAQRRGGEGVTKDKIIEELTKREVLRQEAENQGLLKDPSVAAKIDNATRMVLSQVAAENLVKKFVPTEDELKQEYAQRVGAMKSAEYKARHILVEDEKQALDAIRRLGKGEDFGALAKKISKDPGSKNSGGELGWFAPQQMVPPFSDAVVALKNGEITKAPVKTDFGWHVIQREDSREQAPPAFEAVKDQLTSFMQTEKLKTYIAELESKAKIERLVPAAAVTAPPAEKKPDAPSIGTPATPTPH